MAIDWNLGELNAEMEQLAPAPSWSALAQRDGHGDCGGPCECWARAHREEHEARQAGPLVVRLDWLRIAVLVACGAALLLAGRWARGN